MDNFTQQKNHVFFLLALIDVFLGTIQFLIKHYWLGSMLFIAAILLSFSIKEDKKDALHNEEE